MKNKILICLTAIIVVLTMASFAYAEEEEFTNFEKHGGSLPFETEYNSNVIITMKQASEDVVNWSESEMSAADQEKHTAFMREADKSTQKGTFSYIFGFKRFENPDNGWFNFGSYIDVSKDGDKIKISSDKNSYSHINTCMKNNPEEDPITPDENDEPDVPDDESDVPDDEPNIPDDEPDVPDDEPIIPDDNPVIPDDDNPTAVDDETGSPQTADTSRIICALAIMFFALLVVGLMVDRRKNK